MIPVFNSKLMNGQDGTKEYFGNHWGLAVLHKETATLWLYNSSDKELEFEHIIPHLRKLANSISSTYNLTQAERQLRWTYCDEVYSVQKGNGYDCGIFVMLNAFHVSRGIAKPRLIPRDHVSNFYLPQLILCLLESDTSFLL